MTRKRFVKLLMGRRWSRNEANEFATEVYALGYSNHYSEHFKFVCNYFMNGRC
jgi:hypothetical protein